MSDDKIQYGDVDLGPEYFDEKEMFIAMSSYRRLEEKYKKAIAALRALRSAREHDAHWVDVQEMVREALGEE